MNLIKEMMAREESCLVFYCFFIAVALAESKNYHGLNTLRNEYMKWLMASQQEAKAAEIKEKDGDYTAALNLYLKAGLSVHAAR